MARRARSAQARTELARIEREIRKLVEPIKNGVSAVAIRDELMALETKQAELKRKLEEPEAPPLPRRSDTRPFVPDEFGTQCESSREALQDAGDFDGRDCLVTELVDGPVARDSSLLTVVLQDEKEQPIQDQG
jgi:hypothetical protein